MTIAKIPTRAEEINTAVGAEYTLMCEARKKFTEAFAIWIAADRPTASDAAEEIDGTANVLRHKARGLS